MQIRSQWVISKLDIPGVLTTINPECMSDERRM